MSTKALSVTNGVNVAIVGATGLVGTTLLDILAERNFPIADLYVLASKRSVGECLTYKNKSYFVEDLSEFNFKQADISFFCTANDISAKYAPIAAEQGCIVIDKSSHFRYQKEVPLIVPEVNGHLLLSDTQHAIIASPNCTTIPLVVAIKGIYDAVGISRINIATYQSVSGTGKDAVQELTEQTSAFLNEKTIEARVYSQQIAFNVLPHCDVLLDNGYTKEEMKIVWETQKILNDKYIAINPTSVRVPVFFGHSAAVNIETRGKISLAEILHLLRNASGVKLMTGEQQFPTPITDAAGTDAVYVGRVREDLSHEKGVSMWIVADNLRKGAALNAVQIAELIIKKT